VNVTAKNLTNKRVDAGVDVEIIEFINQDGNLQYGLKPLETAAAEGEVRLGKTDADHDVDTSGTVSVWSGTPGSETDTTDNITAYNRFADVVSGSWVWCQNNGDGWYITAARC
jgi:hypothetical protein